MRKLIMPCPKCAHEHQFYPESWTHGGVCGGVLYIDEQAIVHCKACGKKAHITKMHMNCKKHQKIFKPTKTQIASAISTGKMFNDNNSIIWLIKLLKNL